MYPLGCCCWSCFHLLRLFFSSTSRGETVIRIQFTRSESVNTEEKKGTASSYHRGSFSHSVLTKHQLARSDSGAFSFFFFCAGHFLSEKIEAFLGSSYFLHSKEEGSTRVKTHLFFFPLENVRFGILLLHSKSLRELTLRAEEKAVRSSSTLFVVFTSNAILLTTTTTTTTTSKKSADAKRWKQLCLRD